MVRVISSVETWRRLLRAAIRAERERVRELRQERRTQKEATRHLRRDLDLEEWRSATPIEPCGPSPDEPDPIRTARRERQPAVAGLLDLLG
jgi:hypothetical protein